MTPAQRRAESKARRQQRIADPVQKYRLELNRPAPARAPDPVTEPLPRRTKPPTLTEAEKTVASKRRSIRRARRERHRWTTDPEYRKKKNAARRARYAAKADAVPGDRQAKRRASMTAVAADPEYQAKRIATYRERTHARDLELIHGAVGDECRVPGTVPNKDGHHRMHRHGQSYSAHRWAWIVATGTLILDGWIIGRTCRNPGCCRADHLEMITPKEQVRRSVARGGHHSAGVTHCPHGHPYDEANTLHTTQGKRKCRACTRVAHTKGTP